MSDCSTALSSRQSAVKAPSSGLAPQENNSVNDVTLESGAKQESDIRAGLNRVRDFSSWYEF